MPNPTNDSPASVEEIFAESLPIYKHNGRWVVGQHADTDCNDRVLEATARINQLLTERAITELERLHRYDGKDYDTELDEIIDDRIAALKDGGKHE